LRVFVFILVWATVGFSQTVCATCHPQIARKYAQTGMGRSFSSSIPPLSQAPFYHKASDTWFATVERGGKYFQRRYQIGFGGKETNVDELSIDYVMGSGSHVRTWLHKTPAGALLQLPLAWYAENGGSWAMNPGYDKADQPNSRRKIDYECMSCHNSYPEIPKGHEQLRAEPVYSGTIPEGISCERCHGSGEAHVRAAQSGNASRPAIREAIVNPAKLTPERQMEVCMQCHLETTSFPFPHSILKYDRRPFSYRAGQPLADSLLFFDQVKTPLNEDRFQIVNSVYGLRKSECFLQSAGKLQCTTCHDPHSEKTSTESYNGVCRQCHGPAIDKEIATKLHTADKNCIDCHMPKRRTDDVVHAVMTDHFIRQRKPRGDLTASKAEPDGPDTFYRGEAIPYYPARLDGVPDGELYLDLAQVRMKNNLERGLVRFGEALDKSKSAAAEFNVEYADALMAAGKPKEAIADYQEALRKKPDSLAGLIGLGQAFDLAGQPAPAIESFSRATAAYPDSALAWQDAGQIDAKLGRSGEAVATLRKSIAVDAGIPEAHYALGTFLAAKEPTSAVASFREAIRLQPDYAAARLNLAVLLAQRNQLDEAEYEFKQALRARPDYALAHLNYGLMLRGAGRAADAEEQLRLARDGSDPAVRETARRLLSNTPR
jgi:tetratricopeptide (TPR) repeat protein